jgi:hypothetical protein
MRIHHVWMTFLLLLTIHVAAAAQEEWKWSVLVGGHGRSRSSVELGIMRAVWVDRHAIGSYGFSLSTEWIPGPKNILAPQVSTWMEASPFLALGLNVIYVTDFQNSGFVVRPEIGLGVYIGRLVYGYNIGGTDEVSAYTIGRHEVALKIHLGKW